MSLRSEITEYVELLESLLACDDGIDGDTVPGELRDILRSSQSPTAGKYRNGPAALALVDASFWSEGQAEEAEEAEEPARAQAFTEASIYLRQRSLRLSGGDA